MTATWITSFGTKFLPTAAAAAAHRRYLTAPTAPKPTRPPANLPRRMMAVLMALTLVVYIFIARSFRYKQVGEGGISPMQGSTGGVVAGEGNCHWAYGRGWGGVPASLQSLLPVAALRCAMLRWPSPAQH